MAQAARLTDQIWGHADGEHHGHYTEDGPVHPGPHVLTGDITSGSNNVRINGLPAARILDTTEEFDDCGPGNGHVRVGSRTVRINGRAAARKGDAIAPHWGWANISTGSSNVRIGG